MNKHKYSKLFVSLTAASLLATSCAKPQNENTTTPAKSVDNTEKKEVEVKKVSEELTKKASELIQKLEKLIVMADHGNDPTIGHSKHTREYVPILVFRKNNHQQIDLNTLETMADIGQTVADYFGTSIEYGTSFLNKIKSEN